jgi:DNA-binding NtrC family response regulator
MTELFPGVEDRPIVLFVDDEPAILASLEAALRKEPFQILTATSVPDALSLLARHHVDVIVSDEQMPSGSGSELLLRVAEEYPTVLRIMLTGETGLSANARSINRAPMYRFLCKPVPAPELAQTLRQAIHMKRLLGAPARRPPSDSAA